MSNPGHTIHTPRSAATGGASTRSSGPTTGNPRWLPAEVYDLFGRLKRLERADGSWPSADTVAVLCEWFTGLGVDPDGALTDYAPANAAATPEGTVHLVQRDTVDGLYLFADPDQAAEYAALYPGADTGTQTIINRSAAAQLIIDSQPCPSCGDPGGCGPCPIGDPGCDLLDCQQHDSCTTPITIGTRVQLADESSAGEVLIGVVVEPTPAETREHRRLPGHPGAKLLVAWPHHRSWEDLADLIVIEDTSGLYW